MRNRSGCGLLCVVGRHTRPSPLRSGCRLCRTWVFLHGISLAGSNGRRPTSPTAPPSPLLPPTLPRLSIEDADVAVSCGIGHSGHAVDSIPSSRCRSTPRAPSERPGRGASTGQAITSAPLIRFRNEAIRPICGRCQRAGLFVSTPHQRPSCSLLPAKSWGVACASGDDASDHSPGRVTHFTRAQQWPPVWRAVQYALLPRLTIY